MKLNQKYAYYAAVIFLLLLSYFTLFYQLGQYTMRGYDEARNAIHTVEMSLNGNYLIRYFEDKPDMWETKPPLLIWLQLICVKLFGYHEWAFRLPSAFATTALAFYIFSFLKKRTGSLLPGLFAAVVLLTSQGYLFNHCARTADHDALLIFFEIAALISFYNFLQGYSKTLGWTVLYIILGIFTKSIAVFFIGPGMVLAMLFAKKSVKVLGNKKLYLYGIAGISVVAAYYLIREQYNPGYLKAVNANELFSRYLNTEKTQEYDKVQSFWTYATPLFTQQFFPWVYLIIPGLISIYTKRDKNLFNIANYFLLHFVVFYLVVTFGTFKEWYSMPLMPMLAIVTGVGLYTVFLWLQPMQIKLKTGVLILFFATVTTFSCWAYSLCYRQFYPNNDWPVYQYGYFFKKLRNEKPQIRSILTYDTDKYDYNGSLRFYATLYNKVYGYSITQANHKGELYGNTYCIAVHNEFKSHIESTFENKVIRTYNSCTLYWLGNQIEADGGEVKEGTN